MLTVENLVKNFKNVTAVDNISFTVIPGKIFGIIGPNGAGKTTTLRIILDIIKPTSGIVKFENENFEKSFQNNIGYLPEERGLYRKSKVIDVLTYLARLKDVNKNSIPGKINKWLERLEIANYRNNRIEELSKGNQQKIQFIAAVLHDPKILILDEPFSGFDPINQAIIKMIISEFIEEGKYIILSTHVMEVAESLCTDIFLMDEGSEVLSGSVNDIKESYADNTFYIQFAGNADLLKSVPQINILDLKNSEAKFSINPELNPSEILQIILNKIEVRHFSKVEPTMNNIFLDAVKKQRVNHE